MITIEHIYESIDLVAPFRAAMDYDNVGILVGNANKQVRRVLFCLDITPKIVDEAIGKNVDLILSHHPVIFQPIKSLSDRSVVYMLAKHDIAALCCHTNLDISPEVGVNVALGKRLGLCGVHGETACCEGFVTFSGRLSSPMQPEDLAYMIKRRLNAQKVILHKGNSPIEKVCFSSGAGGEYVAEAIACGAQAYVTGEIKHHELIEAVQHSITVVVAGHYETEKCFADCLQPYLEKEFPEVGFIHTKIETAPTQFC